MEKTIEQKFKDRIYVGMLASICESMEELGLAKDEKFNLSKAMKLHNKCVKLAKKTYGDNSRSEEDICSWDLAFSLYGPSRRALDFRILYELQKNQTLQNKNAEGGN